MCTTLCAQVADRLVDGTLLSHGRKDFRHQRRPTLRDTGAKQLESEYHLERESRIKSERFERLVSIRAHG